MALGMRHKLRSEQGASMMMALLLFLVCTTVASISITAATAVTGRWSQQKEMNQSYYNVTSAAKLVWSELEKGDVKVKIKRMVDLDSGNHPDVGSWDFLIDNNASFVKGCTLQPSNATLFQILSADLVFVNGSVSTENIAYDLKCELSGYDLSYLTNSIDFSGLIPAEVEFANKKKFKSFEIALNDEDTLAPVDVTVKRNADGTFDEGTYDFVFIESGVSDRFRCTLTAEVSIDNSIPRIRSLPAGGRHIEWDTTVSWAPLSMSVGGAA